MKYGMNPRNAHSLRDQLLLKKSSPARPPQGSGFLSCAGLLRKTLTGWEPLFEEQPPFCRVAAYNRLGGGRYGEATVGSATRAAAWQPERI